MTGSDVVTLSDDFAGMERKSCFRVTRSRQKAQFLATPDGLGAADGSELVESAGAVGLDGVLGNEKLGGDLAIAEAAGDQGENFEFACGYAEDLLLGRIRSEWSEEGGFRGDTHFPYDDLFANGIATARDAETKPDAEGREEDGDKRAVELDGVFDNEEAVFGVLERRDEETADETEDDDVALHDRVAKKYNVDDKEVVSPGRNQNGRGDRGLGEDNPRMPLSGSPSSTGATSDVEARIFHRDSTSVHVTSSAAIRVSYSLMT